VLHLCMASFRSDPDRWARYFRVQRMIAQLDRVEREAAEKRREETEIAEESHGRPAARLFGARKSPRPSSALKVLVFGSGSGSVPAVGVDPSPLLAPCSRGGAELKWSRSADGRLDVCGGGSQRLAVGSPPLYPSAVTVTRTHSCDESAGTSRRAEELELTRTPRPSTTLQVHRV